MKGETRLNSCPCSKLLERGRSRLGAVLPCEGGTVPCHNEREVIQLSSLTFCSLLVLEEPVKFHHKIP